MEEIEVIYGTIGMVPMGEYDPDVKYELLNLVSYDGSSYTVHTDPRLELYQRIRIIGSYRPRGPVKLRQAHRERSCRTVKPRR